jgi:hypothetical protein
MAIKSPLYDPIETTKIQDRTAEAKSETEEPGVALPEITRRRAQAERRTLLTRHVEPIGTQPEIRMANEKIRKLMKTANAHQNKLRSKHISSEKDLHTHTEPTCIIPTHKRRNKDTHPQHT